MRFRFRFALVKGILSCLLVALFAWATPSLASLTDGLIAYYAFDGDAKDGGPNGNNGTIVNGAVFLPGKVGSAISLDGFTQHVRVSNAPSLNPTSGLTIAMWFYVEKDGRNFYRLAGKDTLWTTSAGYTCIIGDWGNGIACELYDPYSAIEYWPPSGTIPDKTWVHVAFTYDGSFMKIYYNGVLGKSTPRTGPINQLASRDLFIGDEDPPDFSNWQGPMNHKGMIDELYLYDRALSPSEIETLMNRGSLNQPPVAQTGQDQTAAEGTVVNLDGSRSSDADGDPLTFSWTQIAGTHVDLSSDAVATPSFTTPQVGRGGGTLTFQLTVSDGHLSDTAVVNVTVQNVNHAPIVEVALPLPVMEGSQVQLDGNASYDPDVDPLTYAWVQIAGEPVTLLDIFSPILTFTAPLVGRDGTVLVFALTVDDGLDSNTKTVQVKVENVNHPPSADAGQEQVVKEGTSVTLNGKGTDSDGDVLNFIWRQVSGSTVTLTNPDTASPTFLAPQVGPGGETLTFELAVNDGLASSVIDSVTVIVQDVNDPPVCASAQVSPAILWPPNHKLIPVSITGVTDPENQNVIITVTSVTQNEPINGLGDGDTSPDASILDSMLLLRAERAGGGIGRYYRVEFRAEDENGGSCTGMVTVIVPLSRWSMPVPPGATWYQSN